MHASVTAECYFPIAAGKISDAPQLDAANPPAGGGDCLNEPQHDLDRSDVTARITGIWSTARVPDDLQQASGTKLPTAHSRERICRTPRTC
jgi:hypothetical protein